MRAACVHIKNLRRKNDSKYLCMDYGGTYHKMDRFLLSIWIVQITEYCHLVSKKFSNPQTIFFQPIKLLSLITYLPITFQFHIGHLWHGIANHLLSYLKRAENKNEVFFLVFWKKKPHKAAALLSLYLYLRRSCSRSAKEIVFRSCLKIWLDSLTWLLLLQQKGI